MEEIEELSAQIMNRLDEMDSQLDSQGENLAQMGDQASRVSHELADLRSLVEGQGEVLASVIEQLGQISEELKADRHAVEYTAYKTAAEAARLKRLK